MEQSDHVGAGAHVLRRFMVVLAVVAVALPAVAASASASSQLPITIETSKPFGPVPGTFSVSGAFADSGTMENLSRTASGFGAPTFLGSHLTILFTGVNGTFTIKAQILETVTADPLVLTNTGTWTIIAGTGAYADLHGVGSISGTADDNINLITRTYQGGVHFD
jgi:hypothetical protein